MKYDFTKKDAYEFANSIGAMTSIKGTELHFAACPYCHGGGHRDKNTFSINVDTGQYKCLRSSCGAKGNFITLARDFDFSLGADFDSYYSNQKKYRTFPKRLIETKDKAIEFMETRGISADIVRKYELTIHAKDENILVFPFRDEHNEVQFIKYRNMAFKKGDSYGSKEWCETECKTILFGMAQCNPANTTLVITEGQIDSLSLSECGIENAVSVPTGAKGFTWVPNCWDWMQHFKEIIVFGDMENGSMTLLDDIKKRFKVSIKAVQESDYKSCKDANELLLKYGKDAVTTAIKNAALLPVNQVKQLADVKAVDIYNMPKLLTGIESLDKLIGGLYYGQLILLSGRRGEGKSTFMSQIIAEAIEQDNPTFIYSGELVDFYFKRWLDLQIAGPSKLVMTRDSKGFEHPDITNSNIDKISGWYRDKVYIYDNNIIDDNELDDLITVTEKAIMQYGIKLVCIDNLMTALDSGTNDELYRVQSKFVGKLAKLAKAHDVVIILVAHPRKSMQNADLTNDDVSGSSDITNRVDVVMSYTTKKDLPEGERILSVTKNRLTGKLTRAGSEIKLYYNEDCKRIYEDGDGLNKNYGWERLKGGFVQVDEIELPFLTEG